MTASSTWLNEWRRGKCLNRVLPCLLRPEEMSDVKVRTLCVNAMIVRVYGNHLIQNAWRVGNLKGTQIEEEIGAENKKKRKKEYLDWKRMKGKWKRKRYEREPRGKFISLPFSPYNISGLAWYTLLRFESIREKIRSVESGSKISAGKFSPNREISWSRVLNVPRSKTSMKISLPEEETWRA